MSAIRRRVYRAVAIGPSGAARRPRPRGARRLVAKTHDVHPAMPRDRPDAVARSRRPCGPDRLRIRAGVLQPAHERLRARATPGSVLVHEPGLPSAAQRSDADDHRRPLEDAAGPDDICPRGERLDVVGDLRHHEIRAGVELLPPAAPGRTARRAGGRPHRSGTGAARRSRRRTAADPSSRRPAARRTSSRTVEVVHRRSRRDGRRPRRGRRTGTGRSAHPAPSAPSRSAVRASRFRSRHVSWRMGSMPGGRDERRAGERRHVRGCRRGCR